MFHVGKKASCPVVWGSSMEFCNKSLPEHLAPPPKAASIYLSIVALLLLYLILKEEVAVLTLQRVELL